MKSSTGVTIKARMMHHTLMGMRRSGFDTAPLLERAGIEADKLTDPEARLPVEQVVKLHYYCMQTSGDELINLLHKPFPLGTFRLVALSVVHCRTLGQAFQRHIEFQNIQENSFRFELRKNKHETTFIMHRIPGQEIACNYAIDSVLSINHRFIGWLCNERIIPNQINLDFAAPDYRSEFPYMFYGAPVLFRQDENSLSFDNHYLEHPVVQNESTVRSYIRRAPLDIFLPLNAGGKTSLAVRKCMLDWFGTTEEVLNLDQLARQMKINPQTLRRHLKAENNSFNNIKAQVRRDIAIHYLGYRDISIEAVAEKSGYAETGAFIRAFKGWTGVTPLQFRRGLDLNAPTPSS